MSLSEEARAIKPYREDFLHYAPRCLKIRTKAGTIEPFKLNKAQLYIHKQLQDQIERTGKVRALILKGRQQGACLDPDTPVLTADLRWIPIKDVKVGDELVAADESATLGLGRGNGVQRMRTSVVERVWETFKQSYRITFDDGRSVVCSGNHRWYSRKSQPQAKWRCIEPKDQTSNSRREALCVGDLIKSVVPVWSDATMDDAWFGGMIDGEGSLDFKKRTGVDLAISQVDGPVLERMKTHCTASGYKYCIVSDDGERRTKHGLRPVHAISISNIPDVLTLLGKSRPVRFINNRFWEGKKLPHNGWKTIVSIEPIDERQLIDIQTSTGTFLANGFVSHNSTYTEGRFYWRTSMQFGKQALILTHLQDSTDALFDMTKRYHDLCPDVLRPVTSAASAKELKFSALDSGYIVATAGSKSVGRGRTIQFFHGSEVAFWTNADEHLAGLGQAVPNERGTEVILESTANGVGNVFYQLWADAERGVSEYIPIFVPWFWQPEYTVPVDSRFALDGEELDYQAAYELNDEQMAWRRMKVNGDFRGDVALFDQEYPATPALAFRRVSGDPLIDPSDVAIARANQTQTSEGPRILGVDPAEYGRDSTAIAFRQGRCCHRIDAWNGKGPMEVVALVAMRADEWRPDAINVDCTGVGSGIADRLIELGYPVNRVHFGERAIEDQQYGIRRDEMWGEMRKWFQNRPCRIPDDDALEQDLCAPQYTYDSSRRLKLESKENMRKRGVHSPDRADALALTFAVPIAEKVSSVQKFRGIREERGAARSWRVA